MESTPTVRSWNDPPVVKFESVTPVKKHHLLNKRSGNETKDQTASTDQDLCSSKTINLNAECLPSCVTDNCTSTNSVDSKVLSDDEIFSFVISILQSTLLDCTDISEKNVKEINRRIDIMKESWNSKLSNEVKNKMFHLAQELEKGNVDAALEVHCCLMVQNVREVKNWMVGVKHIIEMKKKKKPSPDTIENINN